MADRDGFTLPGLPAAPTIRDVAGVWLIEWPHPRPAWFPITPELFEYLVEARNNAVTGWTDKPTDA